MGIKKNNNFLDIIFFIFLVWTIFKIIQLLGPTSYIVIEVDIMNNDLPNVFPGNISEDVHNTQDVFYSRESIEEEKEDNLSISSKINRIFNSPNYIYKKEVFIKINGIEEKKIIIGKTANTLLTMDNEVIDINKIEDIKMV